MEPEPYPDEPEPQPADAPTMVELKVVDGGSVAVATSPPGFDGGEEVRVVEFKRS